jgi:hypothetical protein
MLATDFVTAVLLGVGVLPGRDVLEAVLDIEPALLPVCVAAALPAVWLARRRVHGTTGSPSG